MLQWTQVGGKLKWISSGKNIVVGVNSADDIFYRDGITSTNQIGTRWVKIGGKLSQIDTFNDKVWGANSAQYVYQLTIQSSVKCKLSNRF